MIKQCSACREELPSALFAKHAKTRDGLQSQCKPCNNAAKKRWRAANSEHVKAERAKYHADNAARLSESNAEWYQANKAKVLANTRRRQAAKLQRTPSWADTERMAEFYEEARRLTEETGIPHEVDHVIPLQGKLVSGLHVESNLQIITQHDNRTKKNLIDLEKI